PHIPIIFGGAVFEDDIALEVFRGSPYLDYLHCGDGDKSFPEMVHRLEKGESMEGLPGLMWRNGEKIVFNGRSHNLTDMNYTPVPDYDEYIYARQASKYNEYPEIQPFYIPIETARGCWWGVKSQCTFCGLNRAGMEFRSKSQENVFEMLQALARKYNRFGFTAIDNILDDAYIETVFQKLAENHSDVRLHYEVRPYFSRSQLRKLKKGGLHSLQAGVESFSTNVLKLMRKKNTGIRSVAFVKWCTYYGIHNLYNILYGFPGETGADYLEQIQLVDRIVHLEPPYIVIPARPARGSHMFENHEEYLKNGLTPAYAYNFIFPSEQFDLNRVAYYYSYEKKGILDQEMYDRLIRKVTEWQQLWKKKKRPRLEYSKSWETIYVRDTRRGETVTHTFMDDDVRLFEFLHDPRSEKAIEEEFGTISNWVGEALKKFIEADLVIHMDGRYLNLTLPVNPGL
ncbi:MAG: RiPP maturation radical SAM protein 1, partial [bacterium]|nr:RiPP maturation radical SAM protein 1 [bacterium]